MNQLVPAVILAVALAIVVGSLLGVRFPLGSRTANQEGVRTDSLSTANPSVTPTTSPTAPGARVPAAPNTTGTYGSPTGSVPPTVSPTGAVPQATVAPQATTVPQATPVPQATVTPQITPNPQATTPQTGVPPQTTDPYDDYQQAQDEPPLRALW